MTRAGVGGLGLSVARDPSGALIWGMAPHAFHHALRRSVVTISVGVILAGACSNGGDSPPKATNRSSSTTTSTRRATTSSSSPAATQEAALRAAVRAFWDLYLELGAKPGPFDAAATRQRLTERTTGKELNRLLATFSSNAAAGYVVRGGIDVAPTVVSVDDASAQVRDCYDDTTGLYRVSDGSRVDADNPNRHQVLMTLVLEVGTWKVSAITDEGEACHA